MSRRRRIAPVGQRDEAAHEVIERGAAPLLLGRDLREILLDDEHAARDIRRRLERNVLGVDHREAGSVAAPRQVGDDFVAVERPPVEVDVAAGGGRPDHRGERFAEHVLGGYPGLRGGAAVGEGVAALFVGDEDRVRLAIGDDVQQPGLMLEARGERAIALGRQRRAPRRAMPPHRRERCERHQDREAEEQEELNGAPVGVGERLGAIDLVEQYPRRAGDGAADIEHLGAAIIVREAEAAWRRERPRFGQVLRRRRERERQRLVVGKRRQDRQLAPSGAPAAPRPSAWRRRADAAAGRARPPPPSRPGPSRPAGPASHRPCTEKTGSRKAIPDFRRIDERSRSARLAFAAPARNGATQAASRRRSPRRDQRRPLRRRARCRRCRAGRYSPAGSAPPPPRAKWLCAAVKTRRLSI